MFYILSPLEQFEVYSLFQFHFPIVNNTVISLTNLGFYAIISTFITLSLHYISIKSKKVIPNRYQISIESAYFSLLGLVQAQMGKKNEQYFPFIYSIFFFLLISNLLGNIPYGFTITTSLIVSIGLSVSLFLGVTILALLKHNIHFFSLFVPNGTPLALVPLLVGIEAISYCSRAFSLGIRLFANLLSGHTLLKILSSFLYPMFTKSILISIITLIPFSIFICVIGLEIAVSFIQAYVFTILLSSYLQEAIELHLSLSIIKQFIIIFLN